MNDNGYDRDDGDGSTLVGFVLLIIGWIVLNAIGPWLFALLDFAS
jgi:hypothetical protein